MFDGLLHILAQALSGRVEGPDLLDQPLRRRIVSLVRRKPGIHASQLCRESGEAWGTVQYHLNLLAKSNLITPLESGREKRFFPPDMDPQRARMVGLLQQGRRQEILDCIQSNPGLRQVDICNEVAVSRKTFRASVAPLVEEGIVIERRGLSSNQYFPGDEPREPPGYA